MSRPVKRSFSIKGHRTSISLEAPFWDVLQDAARREGLAMARIVAYVDAVRGTGNLSSAVRVWVLDYVRGRASLPAAEALERAPGLERALGAQKG